MQTKPNQTGLPATFWESPGRWHHCGWPHQLKKPQKGAIVCSYPGSSGEYRLSIMSLVSFFVARLACECARSSCGMTVPVNLSSFLGYRRRFGAC